VGKSGLKKKMIKKLEKMGQRPLLLQPLETPDKSPGNQEILIKKLLEHEFSRIMMKRL
jgi:hypothetical protein